MKSLNLLIGILIGVLIFTACSDDDSDSSSNQDLIIGVWKPIKSVDVSSSGNEDVYSYNSCEQKSRYTFLKNGEWSFVDYHEDDDNNNLCSSENTLFEHLSGYWEKIAENKYKITNTYYYFDSQETETEIDIPDEVSFPNSNTMRVRHNNERDNGYYYLETVRVK